MSTPSWTNNPNVIVFTPADSADTINHAVTTAYANNGGQNPPNHGQFSPFRYAFLFQPGDYSSKAISVPVGYYTSVMGLGQSPEDTFVPSVYCQQGSPDYTVGALDTFWRSAENLTTGNTIKLGAMQWAVSQACPLRRIWIKEGGGLQLWQNQGTGDGYSSGGFMADCRIMSGVVSSGSQQQWYSRNCQMDWSDPGVWNMVFTGCQPLTPQRVPPGIPATTTFNGYHNGSAAFTNIASAPVIAEKPYITFSNNNYFLQIPDVEFNKAGPTPTTDFTKTTSLSIGNGKGSVYIMEDPGITAAEINAAINDPHVQAMIITPGRYSNLGGYIHVTKSDFCIIGLGFPTLVSPKQQPCIFLDDNLSGIRISGILLEAGSYTNQPGGPPIPSPTLLQWGTGVANATPGYSFIYDCFARVGGPQDPSINPASATLMVQINSSNVIIDNMWLWRADHWSVVDGENFPVKNSQNPCTTGLQVKGSNVIAYGLAVEHTLGDQTQWFGNNGQCHFYQSELPYDVTQENYGGDKNFVGYRAEPEPLIPFLPPFNHTAYGIGVYCFFRDNPVVVNTAVSADNLTLNNTFTNVLTRWLNGQGSISRVINDCGCAVRTYQTSYVATYQGCPIPQAQCQSECNCAPTP